eukprot:19000_5
MFSSSAEDFGSPQLLLPPPRARPHPFPVYIRRIGNGGSYLTSYPCFFFLSSHYRCWCERQVSCPTFSFQVSSPNLCSKFCYPLV